MKKGIFIFAVLIQAMTAFGQSNTYHQYANNLNSWWMYFGTHKVSEKWGFHLEMQVRRNDFLSNPQQFLFRPGLNYHLNGQVMFTVGYAYIKTNPYGDFASKSEFPEHRFWEQIQIKTPLAPFEWVSRFRLEQRLSNLPVRDAASGTYAPGDAVYTNRFRLLNRFSLPFKGKVIADKTLYASVYDEVMLNFGKNVAANLFDQNRLYFALGYKIPKAGKLEIGYMLQTIQKGDGVKIERNHNLQVGFTSTIDFF